MFVLKDQICLPGKNVCEDAVGGGVRCLVAVDGASSLTGSCLMREIGSDAAWFAAAVRDRLCERLETGDPRSAAEILTELLPGIRARYEARAAELGEPIPPDAPSAGIALFRQIGDEVEFFGLGDCVGAVELRDGSVRCSCDGVLPKLDDGVLERMAKLHRETGITVLEARKQCQDLLLANRMKRNQPGGYWILDPTGVGVPHARVRRWKLREVRAVSAFSDGFAQLTTLFRLYEDYAALHRQMTERPLRELTDQLYAAQAADPDANRFPRFKYSDDTSALWAAVEA